MKITSVIIHHLQMKMKNPFKTSFGTLQNKEFLLLEVTDADGTIGWGEAVAFDTPWYTEETVKTTWHMLEDFLIPLLLNREISHPDEVSEIFSPIRKNNMAKASIEGAIWDIYAQQTNQSLAQALGGTKERIEVGISIGIQDSPERLVEVVGNYVEQGFKRVKVKIKPGLEIGILKTLREHFPDTAMMAELPL